jgi:hypothetical protein
MTFTAVIGIIGVNPFVYVPDEILQEIFKQSGKQNGPIPIYGTVNEKPYKQTLVKFSGAYRFYINTSILKNSPKRIGEVLTITIAYDPSDRTIKMHPKLILALDNNTEAKEVFDSLSMSLQNEIVRYISQLKTEESIDKNVKKAIGFLLNQNRFVGRDKP